MQVVALFQDSHVEVLSAMVANMVYIIDALARYRFMVLSVANMVYILDALARYRFLNVLSVANMVYIIDALAR